MGGHIVNQGGKKGIRPRNAWVEEERGDSERREKQEHLRKVNSRQLRCGNIGSRAGRKKKCIHKRTVIGPWLGKMGRGEIAHSRIFGAWGEKKKTVKGVYFRIYWGGGGNNGNKQRRG